MSKIKIHILHSFLVHPFPSAWNQTLLIICLHQTPQTHMLQSFGE